MTLVRLGLCFNSCYLPNTNWINSKYIWNSIQRFPHNDNDDTDNFDDESNVTTADDNHNEYDLLECHEKQDGRSTILFAANSKWEIHQAAQTEWTV